MPGWVRDASGLGEKLTKLHEDNNHPTVENKHQLIYGNLISDLRTRTVHIVCFLQNVRSREFKTKSYQKKAQMSAKIMPLLKSSSPRYFYRPRNNAPLCVFIVLIFVTMLTRLLLFCSKQKRMSKVCSVSFLK